MIGAVDPVTLPAGEQLPHGLADLVQAATTHGDRNDELAELAPEVVQALRGSGFARHFIPVEYGGSGGGYRPFMRAVLPVAAACTSTGWLASLICSVGRIAACLPEAGRHALWATGPDGVDTVLAASLVPSGHARPVPGGHLLSGTWGFVSGIDLARWVLLVATVGDGSGPSAGAKVFTVPASQVEVLPSWHALGMRATASHSVTVTELFVPAELTADRAALEGGAGQAPNRTVTGLFFVTPMLGAGRGCLASWSAGIAHKLSVDGGFGSETERLSCQQTLARTGGELDQAELLLDRIAADADLRPGDRTADARGPRDAALAAELVREAAQRVVTIAGTGALSAPSGVQRYYRDVTTIAGHGTLRFATKAEAYARAIWSPGTPG